MSAPIAVTKTADRNARLRLPLGGLLLGLMVWSYWPTLAVLWEFWCNNADYSVGMLVPAVAAYLVWRERKMLRALAVRPSVWGVALLLLSQALRFGGVYYGLGSAERLSLVVLLSGLLLVVAGREAFRRLFWVQAFLLLMVPLPQRVHYAIAAPLQDWATSLAVGGLELLGYYVVRTGNVLRINEHSAVMVAEACSGLRMLTAFIFTAAVLCLFVRRPAWQKTVLLGSSLPIAVLANGLRVLVTSMWVHAVPDVDLEQRLHDAAGLLMMPLAVMVLFGELRFLSRLTAPAPATAAHGDRHSGRRQSGRPPPPAAPHGVLRIGPAWGVSLAVLLAGGWGHRALAARVEALLEQTARPTTPLATLSQQLGDWSGVDVPIPDAVLVVARNDDYVSRSYRNMRTGDTVALYVSYSAQPRTMLGHQPTVCYPAAGWAHLGTRTASLLGGAEPLPILLHQFLEPGAGQKRTVVLNYYVLNGQVTIDEGSFSGLAWRNPRASGAAARYVAQVQVAARVQSDADVAERWAQEFAADSAPAILALLRGAATDKANGHGG